MLQYKNLGYTISVELKDTDYFVIVMANWDNNQKLYYLEIYLDRKDTENPVLISDDEMIQADLKDIKVKMCKEVPISV